MDDITRSADSEGEDPDSEIRCEVERRWLGTGHPDRRVRVLHGLRHDWPFGHREVLALEPGVGILRPHPDDLRKDLFEHRPRVFRVDAESPELGFGDRASDAEVVPTLAHDVEDRGHLGRAGRVVERWRQEAHAVSDPDGLRVLGHGREEHLRRRRDRVPLQEVVLDLPDMMEAELIGEADLLERLPVGVGLRGEAVEGLWPAYFVDETEIRSWEQSCRIQLVDASGYR